MDKSMSIEQLLQIAFSTSAVAGAFAGSFVTLFICKWTKTRVIKQFEELFEPVIKSIKDGHSIISNEVREYGKSIESTMFNALDVIAGTAVKQDTINQRLDKYSQHNTMLENEIVKLKKINKRLRSSLEHNKTDKEEE